MSNIALARERRDRGVALLDELVPHWVDLIDEEHLDMSVPEYETDAATPCGCVCAQVAYHEKPDETYNERIGWFSTGLDLLGLLGEGRLTYTDHGFLAGWVDADYEGVTYTDLNAVWLEVVRERKAARG